MTSIKIFEADWTQQQEALSGIRREVFIEEQNVPEELEWDGIDAVSVHVLAYDNFNDIPIGTGRLASDGQIGRMALRKDYRRQGIGHAILKKLIELALRDGHSNVYLHAQLYVVDFYKQAGFEAVGETFMDAGIPHVKMTLLLKSN